MNVIFICGSAELGRDGVGDYTRNLCTALRMQGVACSILAIRDAFVSAPVSEMRTYKNQEITIYRLPAEFSSQDRQRLTLKWIVKQRPDWVSLQFVPFTFHPKGICWQLGGLLKGIKQNARLHVMVHEPWIAWSFRFPFKLRFLGLIQKLAVVGAFKMHPPDAISTSIPIYQRALRVIGKHVELLPLFGNIPKADVAGNREWLLLKCPAAIGDRVVLAGFFGQMSAFLSPSILQAFVNEHAGKKQRVIFFHAGGLGAAGEKVWDDLALRYRERVGFVSLGRLSEHDASRYFQGLDYGLTSYSMVTWGKSGVVATMRDHGLTVIACGDDTLDSGNTSFEIALPSPWNVDMAAAAFMRQLGAK